MGDLIIVDMHTHSESSHDSICPIEEMRLSQIGKGTKIFAVTDHCDVDLLSDYDIYTPIKKAYDTVKQINENSKECLVLFGIEVSEGFWHLDEYKKIHDFVPYDVIIGSVHLVKFPNYEMAYSKIDFSLLTQETIYGYLDAYFNDMIHMIEELDFDVLAHLTCPIRYIIGKYRREINLKNFEDKITKILKMIISRGIALEINTSSYALINDSMPSRKILEKYYLLGGRHITLGSDAHISENASSNFDVALDMAKSIGFDYICYFKDRNLNKIKI